MMGQNQVPNSESTVSSEQAAPEGVNWADLAVDADEDGAFVMEPELDSSDDSDTPSGAPGQEEQVLETPAPEPVQAEAPKQPQAQTPEQVTQPPVQQPPSPTPEQLPNVNPEELRAKYMQGLEQGYALTQEDALALATSPETVMPRLAANMHVRIMQEVMQQVQASMRQVPTMMEQQLKQQAAETEAKQAFYGEWPGLEAQHEAVMKNAALVRQAHPNATRQQVIEMAGTMTAMSLGLDPAAVRKQGTLGVPTQPKPQTAKPLKPAAVGSGPAAVPQQVSDFWAQAADEDLDFLRG